MTRDDEPRGSQDREALLECVLGAFENMWTKGCPQGCLVSGHGWPFEEPAEDAQGDEKRRDGGT